MTLQPVTDLKTPVGEILQSVGKDGLLLEAGNQNRFAVLPLDEDLLDYLLKRSPDFIDRCQEIREAMRAGKSHGHDDVRKMLGI